MCKNEAACKFNQKKKCAFTHNIEVQTNDNDLIQMEATKLLNETITLKLEIENLKTTIDKQIKQLTTLKKELKEVETSSSEKEKFLEAEVVKLSNTIKDAKSQSNESKDKLGKEIIDRNEAVQTEIKRN